MPIVKARIKISPRGSVKNCGLAAQKLRRLLSLGRGNYKYLVKKIET